MARRSCSNDVGSNLGEAQLILLYFIGVGRFRILEGVGGQGLEYWGGGGGGAGGAKFPAGT